MVSRGDVVHYTAETLEGLLSVAGVTPPKPVNYDAKLATVTYLTQDRGVLLEATGLVAWPFGLGRGDPRPPVLALLHGTQGFTDGCSVDAQEGVGVLAAYFASLGYVLVAPDYLGLKARGPPTGFPHPYLVGQPTAISVLDMVRAVGGWDKAAYDNVEPLNTVVLVGGSQGGHAVLWVDRLAPYYAPEIRLVGGVATVPPADLLGQSVRALTQVVDATANVIAVLAASSAWYGLEDRRLEVLRPPYDTSVAEALAASCDPGDAFPSSAALADVFQPLLLDAAAAGALAAQQPWGCLFAENGLTTTSLARLGPGDASYGILFITGEADRLVNTPIERDAFQALCAAGMPLRYLECAGASHTRATSWALPEVLGFVEERVLGQVFSPSCQVTPPVRCQGTP
jgi:hypothetical protein